MQPAVDELTRGMVGGAGQADERTGDPETSDSDDSGDQDLPRKRPRITRGDCLAPDADEAGLRLEIGICSAVKDGRDVLEVWSCRGDVERTC